jgi:outer membrane lipoprotein carrier protein
LKVRVARGAIAATWLACLLAFPAAASGLGQLKAFIDGARTGTATFRQVVVSKSARAPRESSGTFAFARPGKFRWSYDKPINQLLVGDVDTLWIYDRDLNQVIIKKLDRALGATPAALLAGNNTLDANFDLTDAGSGDGLEFVEAKPKSPDTGFERVRIGLKDNLPRRMELEDTFGHVTQLTFDSFERNPVLDPGTFKFVPPPGTDIVGN